jgi:two-component system NarL family sensor kinase
VDMGTRFAGHVGIALATLGATVAIAVVATWDHDAFAILIALEAIPMLPLAIAGASAVRAAPRNVVGWVLLAGGASLPIAIASYLYARAAFDDHHHLTGTSIAGWLDGWPWVPAQLGIALFAPLLFPDGHLPSKRWRVALAIDVAICVSEILSTILDPDLLDWPDRPNPTGIAGGLGHLAYGLGGAIALVPLMTLLGAIGFELKQRKMTSPAMQAAGRQVRPAVWLLTASWWACFAITSTGASSLVALPFESLGVAAVGVTCWLAIRRHGLFDARLVVRRGLVYGALSLCVLAVYGVIALALERLGASHATTPIALLAAVVIAVPLRDRLQRFANRMVFGLRDDPVATLLSLGDQLERSADADDLLPAAARSLQKTLRLEHVAILDGDRVTAESGRPGPGRRIEVPLVYAGETVGALVATQMEGDAPMDVERNALLSSIAHPVAAALRTTALSRDLAASHSRLVSATEEERRRLRRDLHDGLGPVLSSAVLGVARANALLLTQPEDASRQLETLTGQLQEAVADVRRLVYDLRPPALDHLGLVGALDEQARVVGRFTVSGPSSMPLLSAAAEVAAYRIVMEAMTNSLRHAQANQGAVEMQYDGGLHILVEDDGTGLADGYRAGVGITSMRERAAALGGTVVVEAGHRGGTVVRAWLPA